MTVVKCNFSDLKYQTTGLLVLKDSNDVTPFGLRKHVCIAMMLARNLLSFKFLMSRLQLSCVSVVFHVAVA